MLRFGPNRAVVATMRSGGRYVLGVDALPRGNAAAVAVGRTVSSTFELSSESGRPLPLEERVRAAVEQARAERGADPTEVRLVCVDDGTDGADLQRIQEWLAEEVGASTLILDLVGTVDGVEVAAGMNAMSVARACEAALW